jgi:hypothetical protein
MSDAETSEALERQRDARHHLDWLAEHQLDLHSGPLADVVGAAPETVDWFERLREAPLSTWTWAELRDWRGLRRQRLHEVMRHRGLPPEPLRLVALERRLEAEVLALEVSRHSSAFSHEAMAAARQRRWHDHRAALEDVVDPRLAHLIAFAAERTHGFSAAMQTEREELVPRGLFALEGWCAVGLDAASPEQAREAWRGRWLELDDALGTEGLARLADRPPRLAARDAQETPAHIVVTLEVEAGNPWRVGPQRWQRTFAQPSITFGRVSDLDVVIFGGGTSRRHATLRVDDGVVSIKDHDTTNGTVIDGTRIVGEVIFGPGQVATLGAWRLSVQLPDPS